MLQINQYKIRQVIFYFALLCLAPGLVFSQDEDMADEYFLGAPDTIVFVSEEGVFYSEEYLMIHFYAIDEGEKSPIPATFKIFSKTNNKLLSGAPENKHQYQASLVSNEEYLIEVNAVGYMPYREEFSLPVQKDKKELYKVIPLEKSNFITNLKAINSVSGEVVRNAAITIINTTSQKTIHTLVNPETGECRADFNLHDEYNIEINASGYMPYYEAYTIHEKFDLREFTLVPYPGTSKMKIHVVDAHSDKSINARIKVLDGQQKELPLKWRKDYAEVVIHTDQSYHLLAEADGYVEYMDRLSVIPEKDNRAIIKLTATALSENNSSKTNASIKDPERSESFENIKVGKAVVLENIIFDQSSYVLQEASYKELDKLVNTLKTNRHYNILIAGHTDNLGDKRLNQLLSQNRARVIANYLIENGIDEARMEIVGYGSTQPIAPNDSEENRKKNRRVEFTIR